MPKFARSDDSLRRPTFAAGLLLASCLLAASARAATTSAPAPSLEQRLLGELHSPAALADLYRVYERRDRTGDLSALARLLDTVAASPKARAELKALALELRTQVAVAQGQLPQSRALADRIAPLRSWAIIGPFENDGRAGLAKVYPPERDGFDPAAVYPGKEHEVRWRAPPELGALGFIDLSSAVHPLQNVTVYAASTVRSDAARVVFLHLGASGGSKLWVNGELVAEDASEHPSRFDQRTVAARLQPGDNSLLVKVAHSGGRLGFSIRLCDESDAPLVALAQSARVPKSKGEVPSPIALTSAEGTPHAAARALPKPADAVAELRTIAEADLANARAQEDLAVVLAYRRPDDDTDRLALKAMEKAAAAAPGDVEIELRLSRVQDKDANKRRAAIERALQDHPDDADALAALATFRLEHGDSWQALQLAERARENAKGALSPALVYARALDAVGLSARATALRLELLKSHPEAPRAHRAGAQALRRLGRTEEAISELRWSLQARFDDSDARGELTSMLLDRGDLDGALKLLADSALLDPASLYPRLRAADLLSQNGRTEAAEKAFATALELSPDDPEVHETLGRHHLRRRDESKALTAFGQALQLKPQNPSLRELVRSVRPDDNYAAPYLYDAYALAKSATAEQKPVEDDLEMLADLSVTRVFANGLASRTRQTIVRVLTARGVDAARSQGVQYSPDRQVVKVERARVLRKDGTVLESKSEGERNLSEPWYGLYYDVRSRNVYFPQLEPGDAIELITRTDDAGSANFFADYFGDFTYLQSTWKKRVADYVLLGPPGRTFYSEATPLKTLQHSEGKLPDGGTWMRWTATDVARLVPEPSMPGTSELLAHVHVSTYKDWQSVGRFYWGLVKDQLRVTDEIRAAANEVVKNIPASNELGRIRALYNFVVSRTRYVGLEFGIHSFKPYSVDTILSRKFGDCKDKASLLHALLESVSIDSRLTLLRMKRLGGIEPNIASLAVFNHAILYVPKHDLFLDGTAEFHGSQELPADDRDAEVLVVEPDGRGASKFFRTPEAKPEDNTDETSAVVRLSRDGSATLAIDGKARGTWTAELRRSYESPDTRRRLAEERLARAAFPGVKVTSVEVSDPHEIEKPFETKFAAQLATFAALDGSGRLRFHPFGQRSGYVESYASLSSRLLPERFSSPHSSVLRYAIVLPEGYAATVPEDAVESGPEGSYAVRYKLDGTSVVAELTVSLRGGRLQPAEYPAFRSFLLRLDSALQRQVEALPRPTTAAVLPAAGTSSLEGRR